LTNSEVLRASFWVCTI